MIEVRYFKKERHHGAARSIEIIGDRKLHAVLNEDTQMYEVAIPEKRLKELEKVMGYDLSLVARPNGEPHPFWDSSQGRVRLSRQIPNLFNPEIPLHELQLGIIYKSPFVALSEDDLHSGVAPKAEFYIYDSTQDVKSKATTFSRQAEIHRKLSKLNARQKEDVAWLVKGYEVHRKSSEYVDGVLYEAITKHLNDIEQVLLIEEKEREMYALLERASAYGIVTKSGPRYLYNSVLLGDDAKSAMQHLLSPKEKELVAELKNLTEAAQITE